MCLHPTGLLGLVLLLGQTICAQEGTLPRPSISAEPDSVIPRGRPVTIVCRGPAGFKTFRLENEEDTNDFKDTRASSPLGPHQTEARFLIPAVSEGTATHYRCRYIKEHVWSEPSESLELVVTGEVLSAALRLAQVPGPCPQLCPLSVDSLALLLAHQTLCFPLPSAPTSFCLHTWLRSLDPGLIWTQPQHQGGHRAGPAGLVGSGPPEMGWDRGGTQGNLCLDPQGGVPLGRICVVPGVVSL
uniref:Leukocyte immunoglobulin-like receptor subfamily B member 5 isoform X1 n=1 Tax=Camelus bactrianus TaxID=9837 RepID=A0A9W3GXJ2_CAMBA|nr:leukocyte immunoglobulin-like receptor subfamily B member 5 isoform X1 [Camelus bactrianus]